mmetsp:Transcript_21906/g.50541  ORF Transcript_21906/g.50541 Transcript_21906/m.50541 type:complete len:279 (-) Transcript_21906:95-931(-)
MTSSRREVSALPGMKPAPMPWILCGPGFPPLKTADSVGSTATICKAGLRGLRYCPQPVNVPPVPTPPTRISTFPSVSLQISGPVVSRWIFGLSGLLNCCNRNPSPLSDDTISSALAMAPPIPLGAGVKTTSAPNALSKTRRSMDMLSGIVKMSLYPLEAATIARPIPVLPDVGSTRVVLSGEMSPRFSASEIMLRAIRSFTELAGLDDSNFATTSPTLPSTTRFNFTMGVLPIRSNTFSAMALFKTVRVVLELVLIEKDDATASEQTRNPQTFMMMKL